MSNGDTYEGQFDCGKIKGHDKMLYRLVVTMKVSGSTAIIMVMARKRRSRKNLQGSLRERSEAWKRLSFLSQVVW